MTIINAQLTKFFTDGTTPEIAQRLLGCRIQYETPNGPLTGLIVETEAYVGPSDAAAHAFAGRRTKRNEALYDAPGTIYMFQSRQYVLLNFITQPVDVPEGILIRGVEPEQGIETMQANRGTSGASLTNGPGKLTQAFGMFMALNQTPLNVGALSLDLLPVRHPNQVASSARIGVPNKGEWTSAPLRYFVAINPYVSKITKKTIDQAHHGWRA
ncbi:DNA-3-methyladenine glycosylase [Secundilactobacillus paracollinoides]|uniref:DNA-3-methyladenine glycosylase n=1 Tax=Secundilactobacillus paracollinoides TaxID=240427 RepID=UPI0006EF1E68|nr:DNA-3-methyladenine glycosylase [Secundilactobacillus paracollinoides]KRL75702.1 hypothetical protein FC17_GL002430 [Secundilactobacillus paracollinoides DSM 15502 = JCM 11969]